ncbi:hypothetical protein D0784_24380 [Vibrio campbellii]|uniref:hypothetical protein n=1 Tax=Vibrio campbellii TaxID=680 RepID=UPI000EFC327C|nr:hypothetical protein [Vibrio campbellii]AYO12439.1 hypothetical protein D0784_24380 [Vibrio campbellii]
MKKTLLLVALSSSSAFAEVIINNGEVTIDYGNPYTNASAENGAISDGSYDYTTDTVINNINGNDEGAYSSDLTESLIYNNIKNQ